MPKINKKKILTLITIVVIAVAITAVTTTILMPTGPTLKEKVSWMIGTGVPGSVGYIAHSAIADLITRMYPEYFELSVMSVGGAAAGHAAWDSRKCDLGYTAMNIVYQYVTKTGRWDPTKATAQRYDEMTIICYTWPLTYTIIVTEDLKDQITCWSDLKKLIGTGVGVYAHPFGAAAYEAFVESFSMILNCSADDLHKLFNIDTSDYAAIPDVVLLGKVKVIWASGDPGGPADWLLQTLSKLGYRFVAVEPSERELKLILEKSPSLISYSINLTPYNIKTRDGKTIITAVGMPYGLVSSKNLSKSHVYAFFEALITQAKTLEATGITTFKDLSKWFLEFNILCFKKQSAYGAKIHPGTAEVLKKYGYDPKALGILVAEQ